MNILKKKKAAILVLIILTGLLFLYAYRNRNTGNELLMTSAISYKQSGVEKKIALTFDDGPHPYYTEQLLDGLKERGVVASFFVTGEHAVLHPDVIRRIHEEGHLIGNHTYSHMQLNSSNKEEFKEELIATSEVIEEIINEEVIYVRPPYGTWDKALEQELNMIPVLWTVDPLDWSSQNVSCITKNVMEKAGEDDIILLHDYYDTTVTAALKIVDALLAEGYTFVTVEEILFD